MKEICNSNEMLWTLWHNLNKCNPRFLFRLKRNAYIWWTYSPYSQQWWWQIVLAKKTFQSFHKINQILGTWARKYHCSGGKKYCPEQDFAQKLPPLGTFPRIGKYQYFLPKISPGIAQFSPKCRTAFELPQSWANSGIFFFIRKWHYFMFVKYYVESPYYPC